ncbi:PilN domain-containing protein [Thermodesulfobacteriota bacterium]
MIQRINLIPEELLGKHGGFKLPVKYIIVVILALLYIIPLNRHINNKLKAVTEEKGALEKKKDTISARNDDFAKLQKEVDTLQSSIEMVNTSKVALLKIIKERIFWSDVLKEISYNIPNKLWLHGIVSHDNIIDDEVDSDENIIIEKTVKSITIKGSAYKNKTIKDFVKNLEESFFLNEIKLAYIRKNVLNEIYIVYNFEIRAKLSESTLD